jgi:hypothetical protein
LCLATMCTWSAWKNGEALPLTNEELDAFASSVFVSGGDVYVAGSQTAKKKPTAVLWKNGEAQLLGDGKRLSSVRSVFVAGDDVYVAGAEESQAGKKLVATVWKNGVPNPMSNKVVIGEATSLFVSGGDVYVARTDTGREIRGFDVYPIDWAAVQKNHVFAPLGDPDHESAAYSVFVK